GVEDPARRVAGPSGPSSPWGEAASVRPGNFASPNPTGHPSQAADEGLRMSALNRVPSLMARAGTASALTLAAVGGSIVVPGVASEAAAAASPATKALKVAAAKKGAPYRWGPPGRNRLDGRGLPQTASKKPARSPPPTAPSQTNKPAPTPARNAKRADRRSSPRGATGPNRFDCSGLTQYAFKKAGKKLPRTAAQQNNKTRHISAKNRKAGDLVFFHSGSYVYHVGIYAGKGKLWHAPKTGDVVRLQKIWTGSVWYGRVK